VTGADLDGRAGLLIADEDVGDVVAVTPGSRRPRVVAHGLSVPLGLTWLSRSRLVVSAQGRLVGFDIGNRGGVTRTRTIVGRLPYGEHQQDNVVRWHGRLYFGSGSTCDACREKDARSATVLSVRPDGTGLRIVARGLRNPFGLVVSPDRKRLFASVNGQDEVGSAADPEPADMVVEIKSGRNFGWPVCWPSARTLHLVGSCRGVTPPVAYLEPHSSADGMVFWHGTLYVAEWGQYLSRKFGRRIVRVRLHGPASSRVSVFARGLPHPLALAVDRSGGLLVADWQQGVIYRITGR
jgi:glucose/arabinose dehydrogenase